MFTLAQSCPCEFPRLLLQIVQDLTIPLMHLAVRTKRYLWLHLCQVPLPGVERNKVSVLIGTNVQEAFIPLKVKKGVPNEPFEIRSGLGWSILGGSVKCSKKHQFNSLSHQVWRVESYPTESFLQNRCLWRIVKP